MCSRCSGSVASVAERQLVRASCCVGDVVKWICGVLERGRNTWRRRQGKSGESQKTCRKKKAKEKTAKEKNRGRKQRKKNGTGKMAEERTCTPLDLFFVWRMCLVASQQRLSAARQIATESASRLQPADVKTQNWCRFTKPQTTFTKTWECSLLVVMNSCGDNKVKESATESWPRRRSVNTQSKLHGLQVGQATDNLHVELPRLRQTRLTTRWPGDPRPPSRAATVDHPLLRSTKRNRRSGKGQFTVKGLTVKEGAAAICCGSKSVAGNFATPPRFQPTQRCLCKC